MGAYFDKLPRQSSSMGLTSNEGQKLKHATMVIEDNRPWQFEQSKLQETLNKRQSPFAIKSAEAAYDNGPSAIVQRKIDYGNPASNEDSERVIKSSTVLYHGTPHDVSLFRSGIRADRSLTTQLGKGFYTTPEKRVAETYGTPLKIKVKTNLSGQAVDAEQLQKGNRLVAEAAKRGDVEGEKLVKGSWDSGNDFLYTQPLGKVDAQEVPHQVKLTATGVNKVSLDETDQTPEEAAVFHRLQEQEGVGTYDHMSERWVKYTVQKGLKLNSDAAKKWGWEPVGRGLMDEQKEFKEFWQTPEWMQLHRILDADELATLQKHGQSIDIEAVKAILLGSGR